MLKKPECFLEPSTLDVPAHRRSMLAGNTDTGTKHIEVIAVKINEQMIVAGTNTRSINSFKVLRTPQMHV